MLERFFKSVIHRRQSEPAQPVSEGTDGQEKRVQYVIYNYKNAKKLSQVFEQLKHKATLINPEALKSKSDHNE